VSAGFDDVHLVHDALPELNPGAIDTSLDFLGHRLRLPLVIASMTGGHARGGEVNALLAMAAEDAGIAMGLGSQRAALVDPGLAETYTIARHVAPTAFLIANVGVAQLADGGGLTVEEVERLIAMIRADALAIHLNAAQELVQPEGEPNARGWEAAIEAVSRRVSIPVIAKETGSGISARVAARLRNAGIAAIDVGGAGGTSFAQIETDRARLRGDEHRERLGRMLARWGIPTCVSVVEASRTGLPVIATGGVRSGEDAAKAMALGATAVGVARPLLEAVVTTGADGARAWIEGFGHELRAAMYLTGSAEVANLRSASKVVTGDTKQWLDQLAGSHDR
jgi:isopentenyl-diphosphate delta-isomerase